MTSIGKSDGGPLGQRAGGFSTRDGFDRTRGDVGGRGDTDSDRPGKTLVAAETARAGERAARFAKSFRTWLDHDKAAHDESLTQAILVAVAKAPVSAGLPLPADAAPQPVNSPALEAVVTSVTELIDRSIRAEMAVSALRPLDLRVALPEGLDGLTGLRLIMTPTSLDVIFECAEQGLSDHLAAAAEVLAERLRTRFSKRCVRVMEMPGGQPPKTEHAGHGVRTLSDLFDHADG